MINSVLNAIAQTGVRDQPLLIIYGQEEQNPKGVGNISVLQQWICD